MSAIRLQYTSFRARAPHPKWICGPGGTRTRDLRLAKPALYQLSYRPFEGPVLQGKETQEVIEPQVPLRLPCYDFAPLAKPKFDPLNESEPHLDLTRVA